MVVAPVHPRRLTDLHRRRTVAEDRVHCVVAVVVIAVAVVKASGHSTQESAGAAAHSSGSGQLRKDVTSRVLRVLRVKQREKKKRSSFTAARVETLGGDEKLSPYTPGWIIISSKLDGQ